MSNETYQQEAERLYPAKMYEIGSGHPGSPYSDLKKLQQAHIKARQMGKEELEAAGSHVSIVHNGDKWYWCKCENCGWENSSQYAGGGLHIGESGDYTDPCCPICCSINLDGDSKFVTEEKYQTQIVRIPLENFVAPYQKTIDSLIASQETRYYELEAAKKEIEGLKGLVESEVRRRDYDFLCSQDRNDTHESINKSGDAAWQQFKTDNQL